jgi:hypothetical protein
MEKLKSTLDQVLELPANPGSDGTVQLANARHERFAHEFALNGYDTPKAYAVAFHVEQGSTTAAKNASRVAKIPGVSARIRFLIDRQSREDLAEARIGRSSVLATMWEIVDRCMQRTKQLVPAELKTLHVKLCEACEEGPDMCFMCDHNIGLEKAMRAELGAWSFRPREAMTTLVHLGKNIGMFADRHLHGELDGQDKLATYSDDELAVYLTQCLEELNVRKPAESAGSGEAGDGSENEPRAPLPALSEASDLPPTRTH